MISCQKEETTNTDNPVTIGDNIIGKWMKVDINGQPAPTNERVIYTFASLTEAYRSASFNNHSEATLWSDKLRMDVVINGNKMTLTGIVDEHMTSEVVFTVSSISATEFSTKLKIYAKVDGNVVLTIEETDRFVKVTDDYSQAIVGLWEGHMTSDFSDYGDNQIHRWEYLADGTYRFYLKDGDNWVPSDDAYAQYFVDGKLLCTRWKNNGEGMEEHREWWEIVSIENVTMNWTALRKRDDGTTYTASFNMVKVIPEGYVDLGLPSGTLWKTTNEPNPADTNDFYTFDEAVATFGDKMPTKLQINELIEKSQWSFDEDNNIATATGPNGNTLVLPLQGKRACSGNILGVGYNGSYWSKTPLDDEYAFRMDLGGGSVYVYDGKRCAGASVRLVL